MEIFIMESWSNFDDAKTYVKKLNLEDDSNLFNVVKELNAEIIKSREQGNRYRYAMGMIFLRIKEEREHGDFEKFCDEKFPAIRKTTRTLYMQYARTKHIEKYGSVPYRIIATLTRCLENSHDDDPIQAFLEKTSTTIEDLYDMHISSKDLFESKKEVAKLVVLLRKDNIEISFDNATKLIDAGYKAESTAKKIKEYVKEGKSGDEAAKSILGMIEPQHKGEQPQEEQSQQDKVDIKKRTEKFIKFLKAIKDNLTEEDKDTLKTLSAQIDSLIK